MSNFFTQLRALHYELVDSRTKFMQETLREFESELALDSTVNYATLTRDHVDFLISEDLEESEKEYKQREEIFCEAQLKQNEKKSKKPQNTLPNNAEEEDSGYFVDNGFKALIEMDTSSWDEWLEEKVDGRNKKKKLKQKQKTQKHRVAYLSHRIQRDIPELFNGRQFIRQAENIIQNMGGDVLVAMNRAREVYHNPQTVISDETIHDCMDFTKDVDTKEAEKFESEMEAAQEM